jgi:dolichyl-phosphate beta-glucosyltransferase
MKMRPLTRPKSKLAKSAPDLTLIIPAYNEAARLPKTLAKVKQELDQWFLDYQVVVIDDGSLDGTSEVVKRFDARFSCQRLPGNSGKGAAVRAGMLQATGRVVAFTDADLPFDLQALHEGYTRIEQGRCDIVCGDRTAQLKSPGLSNALSMPRRLSSFVFRQLVRLMVAPKVADTQCGLKIFSQRSAQEIFCNVEATGFAFDVEVICQAERLGFATKTVPVQLVNTEGSTISLRKHAWPMFKELLGIRQRLAAPAAAPAKLMNDRGSRKRAA